MRRISDCAHAPRSTQTVERKQSYGPEDASILGRPLDPVPFSQGGWHTVMVRKGSVKVRFWVPPIPGMCALVVLSETTPVVIRTICVLASEPLGERSSQPPAPRSLYRFLSLSSPEVSSTRGCFDHLCLATDRRTHQRTLWAGKGRHDGFSPGKRGYDETDEVCRRRKSNYEA